MILAISELVMNRTEEYVGLAFRKIAEDDANICTCPRCTADSITLALNGLPARYVPRNEAGTLTLKELARMDDQEYAAIMHALYSAIHRVRSNPRHSNNENDKGELKVFNQKESTLATIMVDACRERQEICACDRCLEKVVCLCLNDMKPLYVSTAKGETFSRTDELDTKYHTEILVKIFNAMDAAKAEHPGHRNGDFL